VLCLSSGCSAWHGPLQGRFSLQRSRWFTRGWTLQELLAPRELVFYDADWAPIFLPETLFVICDGFWLPLDERKIASLSEITRIPEEVLDRRRHVSSLSAACKLSWAASRKTTREEDEAYCLLGLLGINMPLLYGEGGKALVWLQEIRCTKQSLVGHYRRRHGNIGRAK
jgi:hypothetical protein